MNYRERIFWIVVLANLIAVCHLSFAHHIQPVPKDWEDETLLGRRTTLGGFLAPVIQLSEIRDESAVLMGAQAGLIINHGFVIGGAGYGLVNEIEVGLPEHCLNFGYGGLLLGYISRSHKIIHLAFTTLVGGGALGYRSPFYDDDDALFVLEPCLEIELNVTKHFRLGVGGSYRFVSDVDFANLANNDIGGASISLLAKFGKF